MILKANQELTIETPATTSGTTKKNRLSTLDANASRPTSILEDEPNDVSYPPEAETRNVGEVRRKVEKMTWKEGQPVPAGVDGGGPSKESEDPGEGKEVEPGESHEAMESWESIDWDEADGEESNELPTDAAEGVEDEAEPQTATGEGLKRKAVERSESLATLEAGNVKRAKETPSVSISKPAHLCLLE